MGVKSVLATHDATVVRGGRAILANASVEVVPGELTTLVGPNGAGKSTLISVLSGELKPDQGTVTLDGTLLSSVANFERARRLAVLPQSSSLAFPMRVADVVLLGRLARNRGAVTDEDRRVAAGAMASVGVLDLEERDFTTLSGGEQQRAHIARVLTQIGESATSQFALFDEPIASLDVAQQFRCLRVARELASRGAGVLVSVHDLNLAARFADRAILMHRGQIVTNDVPEVALSCASLREVFEVEVQRTEVSPGVHQFVFDAPMEEGVSP
ncbi:MAG: heme ABC transporter ATP-binding protein [Myxococcota bacterium]